MTESLESLYQWMQAYIRKEREYTAEEVAAVLKPLPRLSPIHCLNAHRDQHWIKLRQSLSGQFTAVARFLGEPAFIELAQGYIAAHPLMTHCTYDMRYGFPAFIAEQTALLHRQFLRDLAQLEMEGLNIADLPIELPVGSALLGTPQWLEQRLIPINAMRLLQFDYPVLSYVMDTLEGAAERWTKPTPSWVLVVRRKLRIERFAFVPEEAALMQALMAGKTVLQATPLIGVEPWQVQAKVEAWVREGVILRAE